MITAQKDEIADLPTLNRIIETLNQALDVREVLQAALVGIVDLMGLESGWIFLEEEQAESAWGGFKYKLAAHHNLPPALAADNQEVWDKRCDCQKMCAAGELEQAYNEVCCSRQLEAEDSRNELAVHASVPLRAGERVLGILNIASPDWGSFTPQKLALLTNIGIQMGNSLERAHLFELLKEQRIQEQTTLLELSNQLLGRLVMDDIITYLMNVVPMLLRVDACALMLPTEDNEFLEFRIAKGWHHDPVAEKRRIPLNKSSGLGTVMLTQEPLMVTNIEQNNSVLEASDWMQAEGFLGSMLIPLVGRGKSVGVMSINTRESHFWTPDEIRFMRLMVNQIALAIETARLHQQELERQRMEQELAVGRKIQDSLLPLSPPKLTDWEFAAAYIPARQVSGDFYDFIDLPGEPDRIGMVIADVIDKGVPAALFMALSRTVIRTLALGDRGPATVLNNASEIILKDSRASLFLSAFYAELDVQSGRVCYSNAGHNRPLLLKKSTSQCQELSGAGSLLALMEDQSFEEHAIWMEPGDILVLYTDGVTEAMNLNRDLFGEDNLRQVIEKIGDVSAQAMLDGIMRSIEYFVKEAPRTDDLTLVVVQRMEKN
jgi:sigma-B regulation protein RsbU (phosphoserine phosphatase)